MLNPLTVLQWKKCSSITEEDSFYSPSGIENGINWAARLHVYEDQKKYLSSVFFKGKLYLGVSYIDTRRIQMDDHMGWLFEFSEDLKSWKRLQPLPSALFGLSTYRSQLVLVGGLDVDTERLTNSVWVSDDGVKPWKKSLPPLSKPRHSATVANTGHPEYLVVAGGSSRKVEVLVNNQWVNVGFLPFHALPVSYTLYNGNLLFVATLGYVQCFVYCKLQALFDLCSKPGDVTVPEGFWNGLVSSYRAYGGHVVDIARYTLVSLGGFLVQTYQNSEVSSVYVLSAGTEAWVHVADIPEDLQCDKVKMVLATPHGDLVIIGESGEELVVLRVSAKGECVCWILIIIAHVDMHEV
jgi:uncharacterized protein